ncbi:MAG TPA: glycosyltransferase [Candidatus Moranbacteria bacterium]|nr:glycosyltransferase [Candidatus Moranbacteria bacterium]
MNSDKVILFLSEMPVTNGIIQAQMLPVVFEAAKKGYRVKIIETVGRFDSQEKYRSELEKKLEENNVEIEKITVPRHTFLPSIFYFSFRSRRIIKNIIKNSGDKSFLVYARNYKFTPLLLWISRCYKIPFVYSPRGAYVAERKFYRRIKDIAYASRIKSLEKKAILKSAATIFETENFKNHIADSYGIKNANLTVIPNFYDASLLPPSDWNREKMRQKLGISGKNVIVYAGTVEVWYEFEKMFDLVSRLKKNDSRIFFQLFLKEDYARDESRDILNNLENRALKFGLKKGEDFNLSSYPPKERYYYLAACDAGICLTTSNEFKTIMMYLKLVDYLGAGLPIIVNQEVLEAKKIIQEANAGYTVDYNDWEASVSQIKTESLFDKTNIKRDKIQAYSSEKVISLYFDLFASVF